MGDLKKLRERTAFFGHCPAEHDRPIHVDSPTRNFAIHCAECQEQRVRLRISCAEGEVVVQLTCTKCGERETFPSRWVDCDTSGG